MADESRPRAVVEVLDDGTVVATVTVAGDLPELFVVDVCARVDLAAQTLGCTVRLRDPRPELTELAALAGLPPPPPR